MFEKEKKNHKEKQPKTHPIGYPPQINEQLKQSGIDPNTVTLQQLFSETLDESGNDLSLMSGAETEILITYFTTRKYLTENYPNTPEANKQGQQCEEEPEEHYQINITKARLDPLSKVFVTALTQLKDINDKISILQHQASDYEKFCLRLYWHLTYNWNHAQDLNSFREILLDSDIFEIVEAYFKICRKYHVPTFEEPYYFLSETRQREIKLEGDMLKRSTEYSDNEIQVSILEAFL